jgi:hypothetical protein
MAAKRVRVVIAYGDLWSEIVADEVSYAPDAVDDMVGQCSRAFSVAIAELRAHGVIRTWDDEDEALGDLVEELMSEEGDEEDEDG